LKVGSPFWLRRKTSSQVSDGHDLGGLFTPSKGSRLKPGREELH
jgi:hypothetical protein